MRTDDQLTDAAFAAYHRVDGDSAPIPANDSGVVEHGGRLYVRLVNVNGTLAVYRVRTDGTLSELAPPVGQPFGYGQAARICRSSSGVKR
jgi:hypothetical protein